MRTSRIGFGAQTALKRFFDLLISISGLILIWPALLAIAVAIKLDSRGPVFYRHRRIGMDGKPFDLYKFRTMVCGGDDSSYMRYLKELIESERNGSSQGLPYAKMNGDHRITRVGKILRDYYLDEFPQLINIIRGEMSLVGPRPHVQFEVNNYSPEQQRRLSVKPGMTGLWQISGKADCTFCELIRMDLEYIDHWSIWHDTQILFRTLALVFNGGEKVWARMVKEVPETDRSTMGTTAAAPATEFIHESECTEETLSQPSPNLEPL